MSLGKETREKLCLSLNPLLFFSWDPSPQKGDLTHHRAGLQKTCQLPHAAPTPLTLLTPHPSYWSNLTRWAGAAHFILAHWAAAELHSHLCQWFGRLIRSCLVSLSPPHPSVLSSTSSAPAGDVCPVPQPHSHSGFHPRATGLPGSCSDLTALWLCFHNWGVQGDKGTVCLHILVLVCQMQCWEGCLKGRWLIPPPC